MAEAFTVRIDVKLADYHQAVAADTPILHYRLDELAGAPITLDSGSGQAYGDLRGGAGFPSYDVGPTMGVTGQHNTCASFDGSNDWIMPSKYPSLNVSQGGFPVSYPDQSGFTVEAWVKFDAIANLATMYVFSMLHATGSKPILYIFRSDASGGYFVRWGLELGGEQTVQYNDASFVPGTWFHIVGTATFDSASQVTLRLYVDGDLVAGPTAKAIAPNNGGTPVIGQTGSFTAYYDGLMDEVAIYGSALSAARVTAHYEAAQWTDLGDDVLMPVGCRYGITGNGPRDVVAGSGELTFELNNAASNSAATLGYYSPANASRRTGWGYGVPVRWVATYSATEYVLFIGRVWHIDVMPGRYSEASVRVVAYDAMHDLLSTNVRELAIQTDQQEDDLIKVVINAIPASARPWNGFTLSAGLDTYAYAFHDVGDGSTALSVLKDIVMSSLGRLACDRTGKLIYKTRQDIVLLSSSMTIATDQMQELSVPAGLDNVYNRVRVTMHPKSVDASATTVLWQQEATPSDPIAPGASKDIWVTFRDPDHKRTLIGGLAVVTPVATTDYTANASDDGSGADLTSSLTITFEPFASTAHIVILNTSALPAYLTSLRVRGKGVYDYSQHVSEKVVDLGYGDRRVSIDMPYQENYNVGRNAAEYVWMQYSALGNRVDAVGFEATRSTTFMTNALALSPLDAITLSETVSGISALLVVIHSVDLRMPHKNKLFCRWGVAPAAPFVPWQLGVAGHSELGETTDLGF